MLCCETSGPFGDYATQFTGESFKWCEHPSSNISVGHRRTCSTLSGQCRFAYGVFSVCLHMVSVMHWNKIGLTVGISPCSSASGFADCALGCFAFKMLFTSGVSSRLLPLLCSVMREIAAWMFPLLTSVSKVTIEFWTYDYLVGSLNWMLCTSSNNSLIFPSFHIARHRDRCLLGAGFGIGFL